MSWGWRRFGGPKERRDVSFEALLDAAEITLRAERALGKMLEHVVRQGQNGRESNTTLLSDLGITKMQPGRWQETRRIFDLWLACWTQQEIADELDVSQQEIAKQIEGFTTDGKSAVYGKTQQAAAEHATDFDPPIYNVWKQQEKTSGWVN